MFFWKVVGGDITNFSGGVLKEKNLTLGNLQKCVVVYCNKNSINGMEICGDVHFVF